MRMLRSWVVVLICIVCANSVSADAAKIQKILQSSGYAAEKVGIYIKKLGSDAPVVSFNQDKKFNPASVMKLVTGAACFDLLGRDYRFETRVYLGGEFDRDSGVVKGDLYIVGGGDPGFTAEKLWLFSQNIRHMGIKKIEGDLVFDDSFFDTVGVGPGFSLDNSSRAYEAPVSALSASFNSVAVHVAPGARPGSPVHIEPFPRIRDIPIISTAKTQDASNSTPLQVRTEKVNGRTSIMVYGGMSVNDMPRYIYRKVWDTWQNFGRVLWSHFEESGIVLDGSMRKEMVPAPANNEGAFYVFKSDPLQTFVDAMYKYSSNFAAEMLFKTISAEKENMPGSWDRSAQLVGEWWKEQKLPDSVNVVNGSGMGNFNRVTPMQIGALLEAVWTKKNYNLEYVNALSVAGVDGTLKSRFKYSPLKGMLRAKTGTLNSYGVSTLAGFVFAPGGTYVFAVFVNNGGAAQYNHWQLQRKILEEFIP
ncbi:MAG: D-alanyl-D-alanine carboxypeptidase/D-alanyl-D-alanine-endopeptidase, partial [Fibrobacterota bacterium]